MTEAAIVELGTRPSVIALAIALVVALVGAAISCWTLVRGAWDQEKKEQKKQKEKQAAALALRLRSTLPNVRGKLGACCSWRPAQLLEEVKAPSGRRIGIVPRTKERKRED